MRCRRSSCCRGLDPIGDTESATVGLQERLNDGCRGLDPIGDTESRQGPTATEQGRELQRARSDWGY